jgi:hypothetical protein
LLDRLAGGEASDFGLGQAEADGVVVDAEFHGVSISD